MLREWESEEISVTNDVATCEVIEMTGFAGGAYYIVSGSITSVAWWGSHKDDGTYVAIQELSAGSYIASTQTIAASKAYPIPDSCFGFPNLKAVANATGVIRITKKS